MVQRGTKTLKHILTQPSKILVFSQESTQPKVGELAKELTYDS
jgi:hypothetical protein